MASPRRLLGVLLLFAVVLGVVACGGAGPAPVPQAELDPEDPTLLRRPFTAEEIRDEWVEGFTLKVLTTSPRTEQRQLWTVVGADEDGVDIEFTNLDAEGNPLDGPEVRRSRWVELRDHGSFEASGATRVERSMDTPLGNLEGWLYTVRDDVDGTVTEYFFARELPGAPVHMKVTKDGETFLEMTQLERSP